MKSSQKLFKRLFTALLAFVIFSAFSTIAFADVWIPPTDQFYKEEAYYILQSAAGRRSMNLFLSNFSEANMERFEPAVTTDAQVLKILLKHFELNAGSYSGVSVKSEGGVKVMTITQSTIEKAAKNMFNRTFNKHPAAGFEGFQNGSYTATAAQAGMELRVLSVANYIEYFGDNIYEAFFTIYKVESGIDKYYSYQSFEMEDNAAIKKIGSGSAKFNYLDGTGLSAFRLAEYSLNDDINRVELMVMKPNEPVVPAAIDPVSKTDAQPATQATTDQTPPLTDDNASSEVTTISGKSVIDEDKDNTDRNKLVIATAVALSTAVGATVTIVIIYKKKKEQS